MTRDPLIITMPTLGQRLMRRCPFCGRFGLRGEMCPTAAANLLGMPEPSTDGKEKR